MEQVVKENLSTVQRWTKQITHYLEKVQDIEIGKFDEKHRELYLEKIDEGIEGIVRTRNLLVPSNQSVVAVRILSKRKRHGNKTQSKILLP